MNRKLASVWGAALLVMTGAEAMAADPCGCEQYLDFVRPVAGLAGEVSRIGVAAFHPGEAPFSGARQWTELRASQLEVIETLPEHCRPMLRASLPRVPRVRTVVWASYGGEPDPFVQSAAEPHRLLSAYRSLQREAFFSCNDLLKSGTEVYLECVKTSDLRTYTGFGKLVSGKSSEELARAFEDAGMEGIGAQDARVIQAFHAILNSSGDGALAYARRHGKELSEEQWITVTQMIGKRAQEDWSTKRASESKKLQAEGAVTLDEILRTGARNEAAGVFPGGGPELEGGVCRDIASAQGQLLEATGRFDNVYVVTYSTITGSSHVTMLAQSRSDRGRIHRLNYEDRHDSHSGDSGTLYAGGRDVSIAYRIAEPGGRIVSTQSSEMGDFLRRAAGSRPIDPLARAGGFMIGAELDVSQRGTSLARIGMGKDGAGNRYYFTGFTQNWGAGGNLPGHAAVVLGTQKRPAGSNGTSSDNEVHFIYTEVEQHFTAERRLAEDVKLVSDTGAAAMGLAGRSEFEGSGSALGDADLRLSQELRLEHRVSPGVTMLYRAGGVMSPGLADIRDVSVQMPAPVIDQVYGGVEARYAAGDLAATGSVLVVGNDAFGARIRLEAGVAGRYAGASLGYEGRLGEDTAPFLDGWTRKAFGTVMASPHESVKFTLEGSANLDSALPPGGGVSLGLDADW